MSARRRRTSSERRRNLRKGIYIIPSLFTVGNIFCGFFSLVETMRGRLDNAAVLVLVAVVADMLDGRIARLTKTTSAFGEAYDSLADVVSFGTAPAVLAVQWGLWQRPKLGVAVAFLFLVAGSIRLARFNSRPHSAHHFEGLPIPAGAAAIALLVLVSPEPVQNPYFLWVVAGFVLCLSLLMVSNLPYRAFKDVDLRKRWPATTVFLIAFVFSMIVFARAKVLSLLLAAYILSAPVSVLAGLLRRRPHEELTPSPGPEPLAAEGAADEPRPASDLPA